MSSSKKFIIKQLTEHADEMLYSLWTFSNRNTTTMERNIRQLKSFTRQDLERELSTMPSLSKHLKRAYNVDVINFLSLYFKMLSDNYYCKTGKYSQSTNIKNNQEIISTVLKQTLDILNKNDSTVVSNTERTWRSVRNQDENDTDESEEKSDSRSYDSDDQSTQSSQSRSSQSTQSTEHLSTQAPENTRLSGINSMHSIKSLSAGASINDKMDTLPPSAFSFKAGHNEINNLNKYTSRLNLSQPTPDDSVSQMFSRHQKKIKKNSHQTPRDRNSIMTQTVYHDVDPSVVTAYSTQVSSGVANTANTDFTQTSLGNQRNNFKEKKQYLDRFITMPEQSTVSSSVTRSRFVRSSTLPSNDEETRASISDQSNEAESQEERFQQYNDDNTLYTIAGVSPRSVSEVQQVTEYSYNI